MVEWRTRILRCPTCTDEMERTRPTFYWCHGCNWKGQIMSEKELMLAVNIATKYAGDSERVTYEMEKAFSNPEHGV